MAGTPLCVLLCCCILGLTFAQKRCQNPMGQPGTCIEITKCQSLNSLLTSRPLSQQTINFLQRSQCGFSGINPLVCCTDSQISQPQIQPPTSNTDRDKTSDGNIDLQTHPKANLLPLDSCGLDFGDRIWGGNVTDLDELPWLAMLQYQTRSGIIKFQCGGVLISKRYVLTAAHCVHPRELMTYVLTMVRLGEYNLESDPDCETDIFTGRKQCSPSPQDFGIEESIPHPGYDPRSNNKHNDIGLVRLDRNANIDSEYVKPICLPPRGDVEVGRELLVAGWGYTEQGISSPVKLKVEVPVVSPEECNRVYGQRGRNIGEGQLCAGGVSGKDSCRGDSGGPLMDWAESERNGKRLYHVAGIVSYGPSPCGRQGWPGVYTRVLQYIPWILDQMRP